VGILKIFRRRIWESDIQLYLNVIEALSQNGYEPRLEKDKSNIKEASVYRNGKCCGYVFVVADPRPSLFNGLIALVMGREYWGKQGAYHYKIDFIEIMKNRYAREGRPLYIHWSDGSKIGAYSSESNEAEDFLSVVSGVIE
jgi:hypothetical protein